jgi:perosamine synthetase
MIPVHLYGHPCAMDELREIALRHGLLVIEDAAEAHGAEVGGRRVGGLGDCATFSFYANKIITTGEGGAITTDSDEIAERARFLRDHGMSRSKRYWHTEVAYNYRMTNMQAALGVAQLERVAEFIADRDRILDAYRRRLEPHGLILNPCLPGTRPVNWMTCVLLDGLDRTERDRVIDVLRAAGVESRPFFFPLSDTPMYEQANRPVAARLSASGMNLPTFPGLSDQEITRVTDALLEALGGRQGA